MRVVIARCQVDYAGKLTAHLPMATRMIMVKADGSVLVHSDGGSYKPLNWMAPPCTFTESMQPGGYVEWLVESRGGDTLRVLLEEVQSDSTYELGDDPGLQKDGVEKHLQQLLAEHPATLGDGLTLVQREYPTAIGPVDLLCRVTRAAVIVVDLDEPSAADDPIPAGEPPAGHVAVEIKRKATIDAVEQLTRYLDLLNRDPLLTPVRGVLAAQSIVPQARTLAEDRGIVCALVDYDELRGLASVEDRLF